MQCFSRKGSETYEVNATELTVPASMGARKGARAPEKSLRSGDRPPALASVDGDPDPRRSPGPGHPDPLMHQGPSISASTSSRSRRRGVGRRDRNRRRSAGPVVAREHHALRAPDAREARESPSKNSQTSTSKLPRRRRRARGRRRSGERRCGIEPPRRSPCSPLYTYPRPPRRVERDGWRGLSIRGPGQPFPLPGTRVVIGG
jgi:hypothetical protein